VLLLGTKIDVRGRTVSKDEAIEFADENGLLYAEINALSGENLDLIVPQFVHKILQISNSSNCTGIKLRRDRGNVGRLEIAGDEGEKRSPADKTCCCIS